MSNHVKTLIEVAGAQKDLDEMLSFVKSDQSDFDFNKIIPMPKSLNVCAGSRTNALMNLVRAVASCKYGHSRDFDKLMKNPQPMWTNGEPALSLEEFMNLGEPPIDKLEYLFDGMTAPKTPADAFWLGTIMLQNQADYGYPNWYEWRKNKWRTKGIAAFVQVERNGSECVQIGFETARAFPALIVETLCKKYPQLHFEGWYSDEDSCGMSGHWDFEEELGGYIFAETSNNEIHKKCWGFYPENDEDSESELDVECYPTESCSECDYENEYFDHNVDTDGYIVHCQSCGKIMMLCDECLHAKDNQAQKCDWAENASKEGGLCFRMEQSGKVREEKLLKGLRDPEYIIRRSFDELDFYSAAAICVASGTAEKPTGFEICIQEYACKAYRLAVEGLFYDSQSVAEDKTGIMAKYNELRAAVLAAFTYESGTPKNPTSCIIANQDEVAHIYQITTDLPF